MAVVPLAGVFGATVGAKGDQVVVGVSAVGEGVLVADVAAVGAHALDVVGGVVEDFALAAQRRPALTAARDPGRGFWFVVVVVK